MSIRFSCPHCLTSVSAPSGAAGHFLDCPVCDRRIEVPANEPERKSKRGRIGVILAACFFVVSILVLIVTLAVMTPKGTFDGAFDGGHRIRDHAYWQRKITAEEMDEMVKVIQTAPPRTMVAIDRQGRMMNIVPALAVKYRDAALIDMERLSSNPSRMEVMDALGVALDRAAAFK